MRIRRRISRNATWAEQRGNVERGFAEADVIKEFSYRFTGGVSVPMQPSGSVAKWEGDKLTIWGMGQGIYPPRAALADALGIDVSKIRFINKWNGCTFGAARMAAERFYPMMAHLAKVTGRPVKVMLPKDQELAQLQIKPETITNFRVGAKKDGRIVALTHEVFVSIGDLDFGVHADGPGNAYNQLELYTSQVPNVAVHLVRLPDQHAASRPFAQPHPARNQVVVGKHDGRNGGLVPDRPGAVPHDARHGSLRRLIPASRTKPWPPSRCCKKGLKPSDGTSEIRSQAARREDSSAALAWACRSIMAATWVTTKARKHTPSWRLQPGATHFQQRSGPDRRWQRDHENRAARQRLQPRHRAWRTWWRRCWDSLRAIISTWSGAIPTSLL